MYCIFCPDSGNVLGFFSSGRDFFLVFKYLHVYICFLWRSLLNLSFSTGYKKMVALFPVPLAFFLIPIRYTLFSISLMKTFQFFYLMWNFIQISDMYGLYSFLWLFFQDLFTDNTKMPKNRLPAQPLWRPNYLRIE